MKAKKLLDAFFGGNFTCELCSRELFDGGKLCGNCKKSVEMNDGATCTVCGRKTPFLCVCVECKARLPLFKKGVSCMLYKDGGAKLVHKFKNGSPHLADWFSDLIKSKLVGFEKIDCIVSVPMTKRAERKRGYNQSKLLAESLSEKISTPALTGAIVKLKETSEQKSLTFEERCTNLASCFKIPDRSLVKGKSVLIVDDVLTTGATADAVTRKLLAAGAKKVFSATVASVEYKLN